MKIKLNKTVQKEIETEEELLKDVEIKSIDKWTEGEIAEALKEFQEEYAPYFVKKPPHPKIDSKGNPINQDGYPSYVKLLRPGDNGLTVMRSENNWAGTAEVYTVEEGWKERADMWQDYVYDGSPGMDYAYVDDLYIEKVLKRLGAFRY